MSLRFIVWPLAEADLENAARWYDEERPGLADRFLTDVDRAFNLHAGLTSFRFLLFRGAWKLAIWTVDAGRVRGIRFRR